jgi:hypothetical protein
MCACTHAHTQFGQGMLPCAPVGNKHMASAKGEMHTMMHTILVIARIIHVLSPWAY